MLEKYLQDFHFGIYKDSNVSQRFSRNISCFMLLKPRKQTWRQVLRKIIFLMLWVLLVNNAELVRAESHDENPESMNFEVPEINFEEWLLHEPTCGSELPSIKWQKAAYDILNFTVVFKNLYSVRFAALNFEQLKKYSYTINKSADFLNKFPKFVKKILPNLSTMDDVIFMENALDIFCVLEQWRHFLLDQMYSHIENLSKNTQGIYVRNPFQALLFGFRKHITNEKQFLKQFLRSVMEARVDNMIIPARYMKGSLPGLDVLMKDLNVSSPIENLYEGFYRISVPSSENSCLVQETGNRITIQKNSKNGGPCLHFMFTKGKHKEDIIIGVKERSEVVKLKNSPMHEAILTNVKSTDEYNQFRVLKLSNGNIWIVCKTDVTLFLARTRDLGKVQGKEPLCNSSSNKLYEWRIERMK